MANELTEDAKQWGDNVWIYCGSHLRPHLTGWCTVGVDNKVHLAVDNERSAYAKCERLELPLYKAMAAPSTRKET